ncbi:pirin family protein [Microbacterium sp. NPDC089189]|uniref:pirin family protein n=1 Tax=Microbacterium sp. NPDC089189 TaxID=3154972 RepID=UPI003423F759
MTRLDADADVHTEGAVECDGPRRVVLDSREVPLGGLRGMQVMRALPQRELPMIGAWCFLDRFGPQETLMRVEPHPHIGLQTVTWPLVGEVRHRDGVGSDVLIARGQLNLMTSGAGIAHSEYSLGDDPIPLDALQLWVALPESRRHGAAAFEQHTDLPHLSLPAEAGDAASATVVLGEFAGVHSPATTYTPIVGAEIVVPAGGRVRVPLRRDWEYALVPVEGAPVVEDGDPLGVMQLLYLGRGRDGAVIDAGPDGAVVFLLGGEPFEDEIVMWWNFVAREHEEIEAAREAWEAGDERFAPVVGHGPERVPAPPLPGVRLTRRRRRL